MLSYYDRMDKYDTIKEWYDGYRFGDLDSDIDNLWSVLFTTGYLTLCGEPEEENRFFGRFDRSSFLDSVCGAFCGFLGWGEIREDRDNILRKDTYREIAIRTKFKIIHRRKRNSRSRNGSFSSL
ncbi:MAG: hypothetical protein NC307_06535 [Roseburia sp.]|nr:hypothetical protein [Roseburia sp.]